FEILRPACARPGRPARTSKPRYDHEDAKFWLPGPDGEGSTGHTCSGEGTMVEIVSKRTHILDPLSTAEISEAVRIIRGEGQDSDRYLFSQVELLEPPK